MGNNEKTGDNSKYIYEYVTEEKDGKKVKKKIKYKVVKKKIVPEETQRVSVKPNKRKKKKTKIGMFASRQEKENGMPMFWAAVTIMVITIPILIFILDFFIGLIRS